MFEYLKDLEQDNIAVIIAAVIPAVFTAISLIITTIFAYKGYREEVKKIKLDISLNKVVECISSLQNILDSVLASDKESKENSSNQSKEKKVVDQHKEAYQKTMANIFSYGSRKSIKIMKEMQHAMYSKDDKNKTSNIVIAYYILLICQLKYDITNEKVCPDDWLKMRLSDYDIMIQGLTKENNKIVKKLKLKRFMRIK